MDGFPGPKGRVGHPDLTQNIGQIRAPWLAAALGAADPVLAHQALDRAARDRLPGPVKRDPHPPGSVGVVVARMQLPDPFQ
jgi:hypothetical protein